MRAGIKKAAIVLLATSLLVALPASKEAGHQSRLDIMARDGFAVTIFERYRFSLTPDGNRIWQASLTPLLKENSTSRSGMEHRALAAVRESADRSVRINRQAVLAARRFRLRNPELLYAITEFERSYANIWTDLQNYLCARGLPVGKTFGPLQMSVVTARNIEKKMLADPDIPTAIKRNLLPSLSGDREYRRRLLDERWAYNYAAAWVYLWQKSHPTAPLMDFVISWNDTADFKNHWFDEAPKLLVMPET